MIFGSLDEFLSPKVTKKNIIYGAYVATENLYKALFKYGTFDEFHFFLSSPKKTIDNINKRSVDFPIDFDRVKFITKNLLPSYLNKIEYSLFFTSSPNLSNLAYLRSHYASRYFSVCGYSYTVSYPHLLREIFFNNMISELYNFDSIICSSSAVRTAIEKINNLISKTFSDELRLGIKYKGRMDCIPLGIETACFGKTEKFKARNALNLPKDKTLILYFGRFSLYDKMDLSPLLVVYKELLQKRKDILLILAGNDAQDRFGIKLKNIARKMGILSDIHFYFSPSQEKKYLLYSASDIFVSPSDNIQESFGLTVLEAMASGLPVIVSDWNGYRDIVRQGKNGFLIPTYWANCAHDISLSSRIYQDWHRDHLLLSQSVYVDIKRMYQYIDALIKNKELRLKLGENARDSAFSNYDWGILINKYEQLWRRLSTACKKHKISRRKSELFSPKYFLCFGHYASNFLNKNHKVAISKEGAFFLENLREKSISEVFKGVISMRIIFIILSFLRKAKLSTTKEIQAHVKSIFAKAKLPEYAITYHILWLLKKDLIRFDSPYINL